MCLYVLGSLSIHRRPVGVPDAEDDGEVAQTEGGQQTAHLHRCRQGSRLLARRGNYMPHTHTVNKIMDLSEKTLS